MMHALSLWEPWATAMALNLKRNETRGWPTRYSGELAIHAAKRKMTADEKEIWTDLVQPDAGENYVMPYGCIVCVVNLTQCVRTERFGTPELPLGPTEEALGNYGIGRFAWMTKDCQRLKTPVPVRGFQGLFILEADVEAKVRAEIIALKP